MVASYQARVLGAAPDPARDWMGSTDESLPGPRLKVKQRS